MMNEEQVNELAALVQWLNTFESFNFGMDIKKAPGRVIEELSSSEVTRSISKIAEQICESPVDATAPNNNSSPQGSDRIWTALLMLTSTRARPLPKDPQQQNNTMNPARLKLYVLSNLLDCAVQSPNMHRRRQYIERIMGLDKPTQKTLMSLIERRTRKRTPSRTPNSNRRSNSKSPMPSRASLQEKRSLFESPNATACDTDGSQSSTHPTTSHGSSNNGLTPPTPSSHRRPPGSARSFSSPRASASKNQNTGFHNNSQQQHPESTSSPSASIQKVDSMASTTIASNTTPVPTAKTPRSRNMATAFDDGDSPHTTGYTPEPKRSYVRKQMSSSAVQEMLLSPGTLESPNQVQTIVRDLKGRNHKFETILDAYKQREVELSQQMEESQIAHRQEMIKLESKTMDREQELVQQYSDCVGSLQKELNAAQQKAVQGEKAMQDLQKAKDELEVLHQSKNNLSQTTEQLRKFKERVGELQDVKDALAREQEAHGKAIDEIVKLENELKALQPLKRQLDDYKQRALEAEVKLVETQGYLERLERQAGENSATNDFLRQGAMLQKQQVEELQRRIQQETAAPAGGRGPGLGEGMSELNPQIQEELLRLRNENVQLRAFAEKRTSDAVQKMSESLDDYKRLGERYKSEFLAAKTKLEATQGELSESTSREGKMIVQVREWKDRAERAEADVRELQEQVTAMTLKWEKTRLALEEAESNNTSLRSDVNAWMTKFNDSENVSNQQKTDISQLNQKLETTQSNLGASESRVTNLQQQLTNCNQEIERMARSHVDLETQLEETDMKWNETSQALEASRQRISNLQETVQALQTETEQLNVQIQEERKAKQDAVEEAHSSLEATREVLQAKAKKDIDELEDNMNRLLEDERKASRQKQEEANERLQSADQRWKRDYAELQQRSASSLKHSREEAQERINNLKQEFEEQLTKTKNEAEEARENLVNRGKSMIAEAKATYKEEMGQLAEEKQNVEERLERALLENEEVEKLLKGKISSLKNKLEYAIGQNNSLTNDNDDLQGRIQELERERFKMQEENERFRRQLRGRFGSDVGIQGQLEKLQKEYTAVLEENRELKKSVRYNASAGGMLGAISESDLSDMSSLGSAIGNGGTYGRGGMNKELLEFQHEYEGMIENLNDEKRELIMKHSSAVTDVEKAEQRAWEAEQEIARLRDQLTSSELALQRNQLHFDDEGDEGEEVSSRGTHENRSPELSALRMQREPMRSMSPRSPPGSSSRNQSTSLSRGTVYSPYTHSQANPSGFERSSENVLSPTRKHDQFSNISSDTFNLGVGSATKQSQRHSPPGKSGLNSDRRMSSGSVSQSDVYNLGVRGSAEKSPYKSQEERAQALMEYTQVMDSDGDAERPAECTQS